MAQNRLANSETNFELRNEFRTSQRSTESYSEIIYQEKKNRKGKLTFEQIVVQYTGTDVW